MPSCEDLNFLFTVSFSQSGAEVRRLMALVTAEQAVDLRVPQIFLPLLTGILAFLLLEAVLLLPLSVARPL